MNENMLVSVATVVNNDESIIKAYIDDLYQVLSTNFKNFEIVLVHNGSKDRSLEVIDKIIKERENIRVLILSRTYSEEIAYAVALENMIGDFAILMDLNLDPANLIPEMINQTYHGYDVIVAKLRKRQENIVYKIFASLFYRIIYLLTGYNISSRLSDYACFSRRFINSLVQIKDKNRYLKFLKMEIGYPSTSILYEQINRSGKKVKKNVFKKILFGFDFIVSSSNNLLRISSVVSIFVGFLNFLYSIYVLGCFFFDKTVIKGWTSSNIMSSFTFMFLFFIIGIIGEYVAYISDEVRKSPLYHIAEEKNSSVVFKSFEEKNVV